MGLSEAQPFCDGSHKGSGLAPMKYSVEKAGDYWLCACKHTSQEAALRRLPQDHWHDPEKVSLRRACRVGALVAACGSSEDDAANIYCPAPFTVQDAGRLTHFKDGAGRDPRDVEYEAALNGVGTKCDASAQSDGSRRWSCASWSTPDPRWCRVPCACRTSCACWAPGQVAQGQDFTADFKLSGSNPRGQSQEELTLTLPFTKVSEVAAYRIAVGIKPTQEELEYNRRQGQR